MRERLRTAISHARSQAEQAKSRSKTWYDKKARDRVFEVGQEILALLPIPGSPLQAKYYGPYKVLEKLGPVDYLIDTPGRRKVQRVCHVNLLKPYRRRDERLFPKVVSTSSSAVPVGVTGVANQDSLCETIPTLNDARNLKDNVFVLDHLPTHQRNDLEKLLASFQDIFRDEPGKRL